MYIELILFSAILNTYYIIPTTFLQLHLTMLRGDVNLPEALFQ